MPAEGGGWALKLRLGYCYLSATYEEAVQKISLRRPWVQERQVMAFTVNQTEATQSAQDVERWDEHQQEHAGSSDLT